jgi:hypothetical protein
MANWYSCSKMAGALSLAMIIGSSCLGLAQEKETRRIMPFVSDPLICLSRHKGADSTLKNPAKVYVTFCKTCHKDMEQHHTVGVALSAQKPLPGIRLNQKLAVNCVSCHNLLNSRYDDKPWRGRACTGAFSNELPDTKPITYEYATTGGISAGAAIKESVCQSHTSAG